MTELETIITSVTVYPDRARVSRGGKIALEAGSQTLQIVGLPLRLDPDSLRAAVRGARLLGVQIQRAFYTQTPADYVRELEAQFEALQDEQRAMDAQAEIIKGSRAALVSLAGHTEIYAASLAAGEISLERQLAYFKSLRLGIEELEREQQELSLRKRDLERKLEKVKNELEAQRSVRSLERNTAIVEVEVLEAGELALELTYVVSSAGWKPLYDLRLVEQGDMPEMEVGYLAQVSQQTGEAWEGVSLLLSTARPALAGRLPELKPWYIAPPRPFPPTPPHPFLAHVVASKRMPAVIEDARLAAQAEMGHEMFIEEAVAEVETSGAAITYRVPGSVTIPPDGAAHKVTVARFPLSPRLDYVTAPKIVPAAYRRVKASNDSPYTLLPGQANLFAGDEFIGAASLQLIAPQGEIEVYLGVDDRIKVERELKRREVDKRLIGGKRRISFAYEITLENLLPSQAKVTVHDQIPVARHEEIKVKLESAEPRPSEHSELNLLDWELTLAPREKRTLRYDFSVEHPQTIEVAGLP